jgi:hypothetical protein
MLSMIYFSLIIFTRISNTIQLIHSSFDGINEILEGINVISEAINVIPDVVDPFNFDPPKRSCFNLTGKIGREVNECEAMVRPDPSNKTGTHISCMQCFIRYYSGIVMNPDCSRDFECVVFRFNDNIIFEKFFKQYHDIIPNLFPKQLVRLSSFSIEITLDNYNITEITNEYINSTLNMNAPNTNIYIILVNSAQGLQPIMIRNESFPIRFKLLGITVPCGNGNKTILYHVYRPETGDYPKIIGKCDEFQSTQQVSPYKY